MYKILSSLLKYVLWLAAVLLLLTYTEDYTLLEKCGMICAAVILIDAVFLIVEVIRNAVRSTKRAGARMKQRANKRRIARAEKRGARKAARSSRRADTSSPRSVFEVIKGMLPPKSEEE